MEPFPAADGVEQRCSRLKLLLDMPASTAPKAGELRDVRCCGGGLGFAAVLGASQRHVRLPVDAGLGRFPWGCAGGG